MLKNSFADIFPKFLDQCLIASSFSIVLEPSLSKVLNTSSTNEYSSGDRSYTTEEVKNHNYHVEDHTAFGIGFDFYPPIFTLTFN